MNRRPCSRRFGSMCGVLILEAPMSNIDPQPPVTSIARPERSGRLSCFGPPPFLLGDDPKAYDELHARISGDVKPTDTLEKIWVCEAADIVWEFLRLRRLKAGLMNGAAEDGMKDVLRKLLGEKIIDIRSVLGQTPATKLASKWAARGPRAVKKVDKLLAAAGLIMDAVMAKSTGRWIDEAERFDRMIMSAETRFGAQLREVDRRRATFGQRLRRTLQQVEDAEYHVIEGPKGETKRDQPAEVEG